MIDLAKVLLRAGDGGHGRVAFRREKYVPKGGPNGGKGGDGGHVIVRATTHFNTLAHLAGVKKMEAQPGQAGGKKQMSGSKGEPLVVEVPVGTIIWQLDRNDMAKRRELRMPAGPTQEILRSPLKRSEVTFEQFSVEKDTDFTPNPRTTQAYEGSDISDSEYMDMSLKNIDLEAVDKVKIATLTEHGQEVLLCQGGFGGRGNESFKGPAMTTPLFAEYGTPAEERLIMFELQLLADVGLVGLPNAGKSSFMGRVTKANPRIDSYPFTTLEPQLGIWSNPHIKSGDERTELVLADIPGLIEGASEGKGLGFTFLRHIKACHTLIFLLAGDDELYGRIQSGAVTVTEFVDEIRTQYQLLRDELDVFDPALLDKKKVVALSKADLFPESFLSDVQKHLAENAETFEWLVLSTATGLGVDALFRKVMEVTS